MNSDAVRKQGSVLLIFPKSFYSFANVIQGGLSTAYRDVVVANDEYPMSTFGKLLGKLRISWLLSAITDFVLYREHISNKRYDLVLIIKGRGISNRLLGKIRNVTPRIVGFNFDSFRYNPAPLRWHRNVDKYCTFDYLDAQKYALPLVDLFSSLPDDESPKCVLHDISAILRNHSNRLRYLDCVLRLLPAAKTYVYIFELNIFTFLTNFVRNPILYIKYRSSIHFKPLPYPDYVEVLRRSNFTVDYAHPKQSGITIRCFEALSTQTKIITNNGFVMYNALFNDSNTIVFDGKIGGEAALRQFELLRESVPDRHNRTVSDFLRELLA